MQKTSQRIYKAYDPNKIFIRAHFATKPEALENLNRKEGFHGWIDKMGEVRWPLIYYNKQHRKRRAWQTDLLLKEVVDYNGKVVLIAEKDFWELYDRKVIIRKEDYYDYTLPKPKR